MGSAGGGRIKSRGNPEGWGGWVARRRESRTGVVADGRRDDPEGVGEGLHGQGSFAGGTRRRLLHHPRHLHLRPAPSVQHPAVLHRLAEHAKCVVQATLRFVQNVRACIERLSVDHEGPCGTVRDHARQCGTVRDHAGQLTHT
jgi:hypothetical protein